MNTFDVLTFVQTALLSDAAINARFAARIYINAPENTPAPYCFLTVISNDPVDAPLSGPPHVWKTVLQISVASKGKSFAAASCDAIKDLFDALDEDGMSFSVDSVYPKLSTDGGLILSVVEIAIHH